MHRLPPLLSRDKIEERLSLIFPTGTANRNYVTRRMAASTVFAFLYSGAIEGSDIYCAPQHVYRMTEEWALKTDDADRYHYYKCVLSRGCEIDGKRWYADNSRESIRDETLKDGFVFLGVVVQLEGVPTTSSRPRYALQKEFADLFDPVLEGEVLEKRVAAWQQTFLSKGALARVLFNKSGAVTSDKVLVKLPNGETKLLAPGPSSIITKHVIEDFATRFLQSPFVMWVSESANKVTFRDETLAKQIGLNIDKSKELPDIILVEMATNDPSLVFVEVVATDGAFTERRKKAITEIAEAAHFRPENIIFVTAFMDRQSPGFKKTVADIAWGSYLWFASEPDNLVALNEADKGALFS